MDQRPVRRAILQIGTEKTGSTTLQAFLAANRDRLIERGFLYPRFCGDINQTGLAAYAMEAARVDRLKAAFGVETRADVPGMRARLERAAAAELDGGLTTIFCSEHCHSRLINASEVARLRDFLAPFFDEIRVSVYLRRQDQIALSLYSTKLKSGGAPRTILPQTGESDPYYNYDRFLSLWETVFGRENISARLFERDQLVNGSIVDDFAAAWGLGDLGWYRRVGDRNGAISLEAQEFLRHANPHLEAVAGPAGDTMRGRTISALAVRFPGKGARPGRDEARAFYEMFRASNAAVAARYFPGRTPLFGESFDAYPERADPVGIDADGLARVAVALLVERDREIERLETEIAIREAGLEARAGRPEEAVRALRAVIARHPGHAGAHRSLGEHLFRLDRFEECEPVARAASTLAPGNWEFHHFHGMVLARLGDPHGAAAAQQRTLDLNPGHAGAARALQAAQGRIEASLKQSA